MFLRAVVALFFIIVAVPAYSIDARYLTCTAELATGFEYEQGEWRRADFDVEEMKYVILRRGQGRGVTYSIAKLNAPFEGLCKKSEPEDDVILCSYFLHNFKINIKSRQFIASYLYGYVDGQVKGGDTPYLLIGKCSPL
jgi:hypothetical protein